NLPLPGNELQRVIIHRCQRSVHTLRGQPSGLVAETRLAWRVALARFQGTGKSSTTAVGSSERHVPAAPHSHAELFALWSRRIDGLGTALFVEVDFHVLDGQTPAWTQVSRGGVEGVVGANDHKGQTVHRHHQVLFAEGKLADLGLTLEDEMNEVSRTSS